MRWLLLALLLGTCGLTVSASSTGPIAASGAILAQQDWQRAGADGSGQVESHLRVQRGVDLLGQPQLVVELDSSTTAGAAALLDGAVLLALPNGVQVVGKPRLYWLDQDGGEGFAYSAEVSGDNKGGAGLRARQDSESQAGTEARPTTPSELVHTQGEAALAIDNTLAIVVPTDPRLKANAVTLSWELPATVKLQPLADPFEPDKGLGKATRLWAVFPLKGDLSKATDKAALYVGCLSCAGSSTAALSNEWLAWEGEVDLRVAAIVGGGPPAMQRQPDVQQNSALLEDAAPFTDVGTVPAEPADRVSPADKPAPAAPGSKAKEVKPGTLALAPEEYHVALKPITGSGAGLAQPPNTAGGTVGPGMSGPPALSLQQATAMSAPSSEMVLIPAGAFEMGTSTGPLDADADEAPQHSVTLAAYYIDKLPVTNRQFYNFVLSSGYKPEGNWQKYYEPATADLPVRSVSWADASAYAHWAGKRLPTEAEWEKAARGTDARTYPWGEDWSADILPRGENYYRLVGSPKLASPYGVLAMCGILWQWTASNYAAYPFNPKAAGEKKVLRGGCFSNGRNIVRCANRYAEQPGVALNTFTFRCAKDG